MGHLFLSKHPNGTKHSKATVLEFLGSHHLESFFGLGLQAKRIKSNVARVVLIDEDGSECTVRVIGYLAEGLENTK
jgi:hypothetical protein